MTNIENGQRIVRKHVRYALAAGAIPVPAFDAVVVAGVQLKMSRDLCSEYGLSFDKHVMKSLVASLVGGLGSYQLAMGSVGSALKSVPVAGTFLGIGATAIFSAATTQAVGTVLNQHFAGGGTLSSLDPAKFKDYFRTHFEEAKKSLSRTSVLESGRVEEGEASVSAKPVGT
jgi:uncharacterized protein (DUF697 family)